VSKKIALSKKLRTALAAGAIPSTSIAAVGDFFSPKGGWLLPLVLGMLTLVVLVILLLLGTGKARTVTAGDEEFEGWWEGQRHQQLGVWVLTAFTVSALVFGFWSRAKAETGGVLSAALPPVAQAQQIAGLLKESAVSQRRTAEATESIRDTVKRETSDNPRKELANMGVAWTTVGLGEAIRTGDVTVAGLFLEAGMRLDSYAMRQALTPNPVDSRIEALLLDKQARASDTEACLGDAGDTLMAAPQEVELLMAQDLTGGPTATPAYDYAGNEGIVPEKARLWASLCAGPDVEKALTERMAWWEGVSGGKEAIAYYGSLLDSLRK
jgi:hypothetical protein